jgi:hypothetical protein
VTRIEVQEAWFGDAASCILPTADRPLRLAEFDGLFADDTLTVTRDSDLRASLQLRPEPGVAARAADLGLRETQCCSFFEFSLAMTGGSLTMSVSVPDDRRAAVLDALVERASAAVQGTS